MKRARDALVHAPAAIEGLQWSVSKKLTRVDSNSVHMMSPDDFLRPAPMLLPVAGQAPCNYTMPVAAGVVFFGMLGSSEGLGVSPPVPKAVEVPPRALQELAAPPLLLPPCPRLAPMQRWAISLRLFPEAPAASGGSLAGFAVADCATGYVLALSLRNFGGLQAALSRGGGASSALAHLAFHEARAAALALGLRTGLSAEAASAWPGEGVCLGDTPALATLWGAVSDTLRGSISTAAGAAAGSSARRAQHHLPHPSNTSDARWTCGEGWEEPGNPTPAAAAAAAAVAAAQLEEEGGGFAAAPTAAATMVLEGGPSAPTSLAPLLPAAATVAVIPTSSLVTLQAGQFSQALAAALPPQDTPQQLGRTLGRLTESCNVRAVIPGMAARTGSGSPHLLVMGWIQQQVKSAAAAAAAAAVCSASTGMM
jgi:hypothetical protein